MPATQQPSERSARSQPAPDAIERLYVYWLVSTTLLMLVAIILAVITRGALRQQTAALHEQTAALDEQAAALDELTGRVASLEEAVVAVEVARRTAQPGQTGEGQQPTGPLAALDAGPGTRPPSPGADEQPQPGAPAPATAPVVTAPAEATIQAQLDEIAGDRPAFPADLADPQAAAELVEDALRHIGRARWSGPTWSRLAVLARLSGRDVAAEAFARRAAAAGDPLVEYTEVSARALLARGQPEGALRFAERLVEQTDGSATSQVLLVAAFLASDQPGTADEALELLGDVGELHPRDKLLLTRLLMTLERWQRLEAVLSTVKAVPDDVVAEHNFLQAVSLARSGRTVEALAILEYLASQLPEPGRDPDAAPQEAGPEPAWPAPGPDRYEIEVWRGVTLVFADQTEAARQVLQQAAALDPGRPDAHYQLGLLEARAGQYERAGLYLKNALACSARMAPAWEALAILNIGVNDVHTALEHLAKAIEINPRRASAYFLSAIAHGKLSQPEPTAAALKAAFRLDKETYLPKAKQVDVVLRLFTPQELDELAGEPPGEVLPPEQPGPQDGAQP